MTTYWAQFSFSTTLEILPIDAVLNKDLFFDGQDLLTTGQINLVSNAFDGYLSGEVGPYLRSQTQLGGESIVGNQNDQYDTLLNTTIVNSFVVGSAPDPTILLGPAVQSATLPTIYAPDGTILFQDAGFKYNTTAWEKITIPDIVVSPTVGIAANTEVAASAFHNSSNGALNPDPVADFKVTLSQAETSPVTVNYKIEAGTAVQTIYYPGGENSITIPAGQTTGDIIVPLAQGSEPEQTFQAVITSASAADGSQVTIANSTGTATVDQHDKVDVYVIETGHGSGTLYWTLDGVLVGSPSVMHYDQSLPVPSGDYSAVFRIGAGQGNVIELDSAANGSSDFADRQSVQIHVGNNGGNSLGCIVSSQHSDEAWGSLQKFANQITNLHTSSLVPDPLTTSTGANTVVTASTFETVQYPGGVLTPTLTTNPTANNGSVPEKYSVQTTQWDLPITVHVSGAGADVQPYINLTQQGASSIQAGQPENYTLSLSSDPSYGFQDRDIFALVRVTGASAQGGLALTGGLGVVYDTTTAQGTFYWVTVSKTSNHANFSLTTNSSFSGNLDVSVVGYKEQLYVNWVPNHPPTVPDGQVMLDNGIHDAQVSIIGVPPHSAAA